MTKPRTFLHAALIAGVLACGAFILVSQTGVAAPLSSTRAVVAADCSAGNVPAFIESDTTLPEDLYVTNDVLVRAGATLTLTAGTHVTVCGEYGLTIGGLFSPGRLVARGTAAESIVFRADDPAINWDGIYLGDYLDGAPTLMRHVEIYDGGGNDPAADTAALVVSNRSTSSDFVTPEIDYLTVADSGAYGVRVQVHSDPNPPVLNHLTITGSARNGLFIDPDAVSGLGTDNTFSGNGSDRILVLGEISRYDQHYRRQPVPYEVEDSITWRNPGPGLTATIRIDPGVTFRVAPDAILSVGNNGAPVTFIAEGTAQRPITFTQLAEGSAPWQRLDVGGGTTAESYLAYVNLLHGGGTAGLSTGILSKRVNDNLLRLDHVRIAGSANAGIDVWDGQVIINQSTIENNRIGLSFAGGQGVIRNSTITDNTETGIVNSSSNNVCIDAVGNYWGASNGPLDETTGSDACGAMPTNPGGTGDPVSEGVRYNPWLSAAPGVVDDWSQITPDPFWVPANGVATGELHIAVRDAQGAPLPGQDIRLQTSVGRVRQPDPTGADGTTTAVISSTDIGFAIVSAFNETSGEPLSAIAGVTFWEGHTDNPLVDASGAPYLSPELVVEGRPFQEGFPIDFSLPMRNGGDQTLEVTVVYAASGLNVGAGFTPVSTATRSLQPGEAWDAPGSWVPDVTGHKCIQARLSYATDGASALTNGGDTYQWNLNIIPKTVDFIRRCPGPTALAGLDVILPDDPGLFEGGFPLFPDGCRRFPEDPPRHGYTEVTTPVTYAPPPFTTGGGLTQAQADALNDFTDAAFRGYALADAIVVTADRMAGARVASVGNVVNPYVDVQARALRDFYQQYGVALHDGADALDALLDATRGTGTPDEPISVADQQALLDAVSSGGFSAELNQFYQDAGLDGEQIASLEETYLTMVPRGDLQPTTVYESLEGYSSSLREAGYDVFAALTDGSGQRISQQQEHPETVPMRSLQTSFQVGNPTDSQATVNLEVRPFDVPLGWTYGVDTPAPVLDPGQTTTVTLYVDPNGVVLTESEAHLAVEGYVNGAYVGGIAFTPTFPDGEPEWRILLPAVLRQY